MSTLLNVIFLHGMESVDISAQSLQAEEYNKTYPTLSALPQEIIFDICSYYQKNNQKMGKSYEDSIKNFMRLHGVCKKLNQCLTAQTIAEWCKNYSQNVKDETFKKIITSTKDSLDNNAMRHDRTMRHYLFWEEYYPQYVSNETLKNTEGGSDKNATWDYATRRFPALIAVYTGADPNIKVEKNKYLLEHAVDHNDAIMVTTLFKHQVDPYKKHTEYYKAPSKKSPLLACKTREIAQIFFDNKISVSDEKYPNVLWCILGDEYPADLVQCYLENGIDATELFLDKYDEKKSSSLLHHIASNYTVRGVKNSKQLLEKVKFLLDAMPKNMVNLLRGEKTPIDIAQNSYSEEFGRKDSLVEFYEKLVCLYREYGGLSGFALHKKLAAEMQEYNYAQPLVRTLYQENIYSIFSFSQEYGQDQAEVLIKNIKSFMHARCVCKQLKELLTSEVIGDLCKDYTQDDKNKALEKVVKKLNGFHDRRTENTRYQILALVCAAADPNIKFFQLHAQECLLKYAVDRNDTQMVEILFAHNVDLKGTDLGWYKTKKIAELFIDYGVDVHAPVGDYPNVLWCVVDDIYPVELLKLYLERGVNPRQVSHHNYYGVKQDLLCYMTDNERPLCIGDYYRHKIKKIKLLVKAMPEKINTVWGRRTLLDIAHDKYAQCKADGLTRYDSSYEQLIALYRKHGGLTAEELQQQVL